MVFSSLLFLWLFLPVVVAGYYIVPSKCKNILLLISSLLFYAWGEPVYILLMLFSIFFNCGTGLLIDRFRKIDGILLAVNVVGNLALLGFFKYYDFFIGLVNSCFKTTFPEKNIPLPIGISFFTFQILSYVIDLYRGRYPVQKNILNLALYISFFPQLIAGPIVRYVDIDRQLESRTHSTQKAMEGIRHFLYGLGKKVLIANVLGQCVDSIYAMELSEVTGAFAWLAAGMYMLQIYYDFSGYSDMAIGLGKLFGFDFPENFNYPYLSKSVQEFWRRWHISLGTWFREYLYFPLGGSRKGAVRTYVNLMIVFLVTGLWHGAGMTFVLWGVYYGVLQVIERLGFKKILGKYPVIGWSYTFLAALFGWVLFRADTFAQAGGMMVRMICPWKYLQTDVLLQNIVDHRAFVMLIVGLLGCGFIQKIWQRIPGTKRWKYSIGEAVWCAILGVLSLAALAGNTYNPFIYFRF